MNANNNKNHVPATSPIVRDAHISGTVFYTIVIVGVILFAAFCKSGSYPYGIDIFTIPQLFVAILILVIAPRLITRIMAMGLICMLMCDILVDLTSAYAFWPDTFARHLTYFHLDHNMPVSDAVVFVSKKSHYLSFPQVVPPVLGSVVFMWIAFTVLTYSVFHENIRVRLTFAVLASCIVIYFLVLHQGYFALWYNDQARQHESNMIARIYMETNSSIRVKAQGPGKGEARSEMNATSSSSQSRP